MGALTKSIFSLFIAIFSSTAFGITNAQLFAYAEANYSSLFPGTATAGTYLQYTYQYYPASGNYLAIDATGMVHMMGTSTGNAIQPLGAMSTFAPIVNAWNPTPPVAATVTAPITTSYFDFNYLQNINGIPSSTATITESGIPAQLTAVGILRFGPSGLTSPFNPAIGGGYSWGASIASGMGFNPNAADANVPAVAMICPISIYTPGIAYTKSTDILVTSTATPILSAVALAGLTFTQYHQDCAAKIGNSVSFDASGNATFTVNQGGTTAPIILTRTATQVASSLTGTVTTSTSGNSSLLNAYSYRTAYGLTKYVLVEHGSLSGGYVGIWQQ